MNDKFYSTPDEFEDTLFETCATKNLMEKTIRETLNKYGYRKVEPPMLECFDLFGGVRPYLRSACLN